MMLVEGTSDNVALAAAVRTRINADARMINAKSALWRLAGCGLLAVGLGTGVGATVGLGAFGYSYITDNLSSATKIADAFSNALSKTTIKTDGTVKMIDGSLVGLRPGAMVSLPRDATVRIDPESTVGLRVDQLLPQLAIGAGGHERTVGGNVIKREVTVFWSVNHGDGTVTTGWKYPDGSGGEPTDQYCYFLIPNGSHVSSKIDIAANGTRLTDIKLDSVPDVEEALKKCQWKD